MNNVKKIKIQKKPFNRVDKKKISMQLSRAILITNFGKNEKFAAFANKNNTAFGQNVTDTF